MSKEALRILVVDDEPALCQMVCALLTRWGYAAEYATGAAEALGLLTMRSCDLALIDNLMPGMNGQDLAIHIKKLHPKTPVVMISAFPPAFAEGVDRIFSKPLSAEKLRSIVENSLAFDVPFETVRRTSPAAN